MLSVEGGARVSGHAQVVEDQASVTVELAHFLSDAAHALGLDQTDGEAAQAGDVLGAVAGADAAAVLVVVPIEDVACLPAGRWQLFSMVQWPRLISSRRWESACAGARLVMP